MVKQALAVVGGFALLHTVAWAQIGDMAPDSAPSEMDLFRLDNVLNAPVVTSSGGVDEERSLASANVYSITREEIAAHGWRSLAEALANVPGLYVIDDLVLPSLGVRGVTGGLASGTRVIKVMIDGEAVHFRPELTAFLGPEYIPMEAVERIEIAKGPLSALYGANAFIATVNVITRRPEGLLAEAAGRLTVIGNPGFGGSTLIGRGDSQRGVMAAISVDQFSRSGLKLPVTFPGQDATAEIFRRVSSSDQATPLSVFALAYARSPKWGNVSAEGGVQRLDSMGEFQLNSVLTHQTRISLINIWSNARYQKTWSNLTFDASIGYSQGNPTRDEHLYLTGNNSAYFTRNYGYHAIDGSAQASYSPLGARLTINAGLDFEYSFENILFYTQVFNQPQGMRQAGDRVDLIGPNEARQEGYYNVGASLQATSKPFARLPGLHLTANLRIDKIGFGPIDFPVQYSWRAAVAYRWTPSWVTKVIAGHAFQTPSGVMLFGHTGFGNSNDVIGNVTLPGRPVLRPQVVDSIEAVVSGQLFGHLALEVATYFQDLQDEIQFAQIGDFFGAVNSGQRLSLGLESTLRFTYRRLSAYSSASVEGALSSSGFETQATSLYPRGMGVVGIDVDLSMIHLHGNTQVRAVGPRGASQSNVYLNNGIAYELPSYAAWDITLSTVGIHLFAPGMETRVTASARNLLDQRAPEPGLGGFDLPRSGRSFYCELRQTF
jgi:iron complex outermembrane receptor protein